MSLKDKLKRFDTFSQEEQKEIINQAIRVIEVKELLERRIKNDK